MKRTAPMRRTRLKPQRSEPRPGRLKGGNMTRLRLDCYARDRGKCQECGVQTIFDAPRIWDNSYHMAHIRGRRIGLDKLSNVRVLCGRCHRLEHAYGPTRVKPCPPKPRSE